MTWGSDPDVVAVVEPVGSVGAEVPTAVVDVVAPDPAGADEVVELPDPPVLGAPVVAVEAPVGTVVVDAAPEPLMAGAVDTFAGRVVVGYITVTGAGAVPPSSRSVPEEASVPLRPVAQPLQEPSGDGLPAPGFDDDSSEEAEETAPLTA